jgi:hypothetical protein
VLHQFAAAAQERNGWIDSGIVSRAGISDASFAGSDWTFRESLFSWMVSLFPRKNSLFGSAGNLGRTPWISADSRELDWGV